MSQLLLQRVEVLDTDSPHHRKIKDILIREGVIVDIEDRIEVIGDVKTIHLGGFSLAPGLFDLASYCGEPGYEQRETLKSLSEAASSGGFTGVGVLPVTLPACDNKAAVERFIEKSKMLPVQLVPYGAITQGIEGKQLAELYEMYEAGAKAFTDGFLKTTEGKILHRALSYCLAFGGLTMTHSVDHSVFQRGQLHEGPVSTKLGSVGTPIASEVIALLRDIEIVRYSGSRLHILGVSSSRAVQIIRQAKSEGLPITASTPIWNIAMNEEAIGDFDILYKFEPPLRGENDRLALVQGLIDGTIDTICSGHTPWEPEKKDLEFPFSQPGSISLQTAFSLSVKHLSEYLPLEEILNIWTTRSRNILNLSKPTVKIGEKINALVFKTDQSWIFNPEDNCSLSINSPLFGQLLPAKIKGTIFGNYINLQ